MRAVPRRYIRMFLLFSCLSYGFSIRQALCAQPGAKEPGADRPTAKELIERLRDAEAPLTRSIVKSETYTQ